MNRKGPSFERSVCVQLSLWWTRNLDEPRTDIFWRSSTSGARATVRGRKGKCTYGQYSDVCATDPIGIPLLDLLTLEFKRGYSNHTIQDLLDKPNHAAKQMIEDWIEQVEESWKLSGSFSWMIVTRRDRRRALAILPDQAYTVLEQFTSLFENGPHATISFPRIVGEKGITEVLHVFLFDEFLLAVDPEDIIQAAKVS